MSLPPLLLSSQGHAVELATYLLTLQPQSWAGVLATLTLSALTLAVVARLGREPAGQEFSLEKSLTFLCGAFAGPAVRRWSVSPYNISTRSATVVFLSPPSPRIIFIMVLVAGSLVHWHWKAGIISSLSVARPSLPFTSSAELLQSSYQAGGMSPV